MSNYARCGCEDGYDCTKTTLCHVQTVVEDHESEIWHLTEQLGNMAEEIKRLRAALEQIERTILGTPDQFKAIAREALL